MSDELDALAAAAIAWRETWVVKRDGRRLVYGSTAAAVKAERALLEAAERYADTVESA